MGYALLEPANMDREDRGRGKERREADNIYISLDI